jgi:mannosidase alpha-like ER degradation enhancer 1
MMVIPLQIKNLNMNLLLNKTFLFSFILFCAFLPICLHAMSKLERLQLRDRTKSMFYHGFKDYLTFAFPADELNPLTCGPRSRDSNKANTVINDVLGDYCLTLVDALDTLVIMGDFETFSRAVDLVKASLSYKANTVQVFEANIRILGGLLSAHLLATGHIYNFTLPNYNDELLKLANDLGNRLLPAFNTPTSIPYARVNLEYGVQKGETSQTCTAGAGSLLLEFSTLSKLTNNCNN